ncbi:S8 family peptidase [Brevibacillus fluminis]|uniref:S8 family peptidase n=1 Tax=Brevibacillus fluminis TaxID=511487 RepID=UPI003F8BC30D
MKKTMKCICVVTIFGMFFSTLDHPHVVQASTFTNDPHFQKQTHLKQIKVDGAWDKYTGNTAITIAVLDTGVDTDHPDLKGNLVPGVNLVSPQKTPEDDSTNGHGTQVAGILAARGNNSIGVSGVLWNAKVMPIKILDRQGQGTVELLASGINAAIDRGAKIIVTSLSSISTSKSLENAVNRAEANGVIIVSAAGNEANRVTYPAAYPTVIAVGAVQANNKPLYQSNIGPELNLMAPGWNVYTTVKGGGYGPMSGTSAAAPQVAGAAALILAKYPYMTPLDVRQLLYQSATNLDADGWDRKTGYGLLNVANALKVRPSLDFLEPNNSMSNAKPFPIESQIRAQLGSTDTVDWYYIDVPYSGKVSFTSLVTSKISTPMAATFYVEDRQPVTYYLGNGDTLSIPSKAGRVYVKLERSGGVESFTYTLTSSFAIGSDRYEPNDNQTQARPLPPGNHVSIIGNYDKPGDRDWFSFYARDYGRLEVELTPDNERMDPALNIGKEGSQMYEYVGGDRDNPGVKASLDVSPGKYYIRTYDYSGSPVNGEYSLTVDYTPVRKDTNEPNDTYRQATKLGSGSLMTGTLATRNDYDWFQFTVDYESYVTIKAPNIPVQSGVTLDLYNANNLNFAQFSETEVAQLADQGKSIMSMKLNPGTYYIRLHSYVPFQYDAYRLTLTKERMVAGYRDITTHWARADIARLSLKQVVNGFPDYTFRPNAAVTRAQFAAMLMQAMKKSGLSVPTVYRSNPYSDLTHSHWAYQPLMQAYQLGIMKGYANGTIQPNKSLTRAEMAQMVARAKGYYLYQHSYSSYRDVSSSNWASPAIEALSLRGLINGYSGNFFKPGAYASRAEMVVLLGKAYDL